MRWNTYVNVVEGVESVFNVCLCTATTLAQVEMDTTIVGKGTRTEKDTHLCCYYFEISSKWGKVAVCCARVERMSPWKCA